MIGEVIPGWTVPGLVGGGDPGGGIITPGSGCIPPGCDVIAAVQFIRAPSVWGVHCSQDFNVPDSN